MNILTKAYDYYFIHNIAIECMNAMPTDATRSARMTVWNSSSFLKIISGKYVSVVSDVNALAESYLIVHKTFCCELISH